MAFERIHTSRLFRRLSTMCLLLANQSKDMTSDPLTVYEEEGISMGTASPLLNVLQTSGGLRVAAAAVNRLAYLHSFQATDDDGLLSLSLSLTLSPYSLLLFLGFLPRADIQSTY